MGRKLTQEEFIVRSTEVHNNKYDYSLVEYVDNTTKVRIVCPNHGVFEQTPHTHTSGSGCPKCIGRGLSDEEWISRFKEVHGDKYDYSKFTYNSSKEKSTFICPEHGEFHHTAPKHASGKGCARCGGKFRIDGEEFILQAKQVHKDKYDYSLVKYKNKKTKVKIICKDHGTFMQTPAGHLLGSGCRKCANGKISSSLKHSREMVVDKFIEIHGNKYDYSLVIYKGDALGVDIICRDHGVFTQAPSQHKLGKGCPKCKVDKFVASRKVSFDEFVEESNKTHKGKYSYSEENYIDSLTHVDILCPTHGIFWQVPSAHKLGKGCWKCAVDERADKKRLSEDLVLKDFKDTHGDKYTYDKFKYEGAVVSSTITCPIHGDFKQSPYSHKSGAGCPKCAGYGPSKPEQEIYDFVKTVVGENIEVVQSDRNIIKPKELDIYIPSKNLAIEMNGIYYHSDQRLDRRYHFNKWKECKEKGIRLIQITDYEWKTNKDKFKGIISNALGLNINSNKKVNARQCTIEKLTASECKDFFNTNHPQGHTGNPENYALRDKEGCVVAIMSFGKNKTSRGAASTTGTWELSRYATACSVRGGASKLFKAFIVEHNPETVKSFSMNDWFSGGVYEVLGFDGEIIAPDYKVYHPKIGLSPKSAWQRRNIPKRLEEIGSSITYSPETDERTEWQMEDLVGAYRVWDSGKIRWVWKNPNINSDENSQE